MNMNELFAQLHVNEQSSIQDKLGAIEGWCAQHLSHDLRFHEGDVTVRYDNYLTLTEEYLDAVLPYIPKDLNDPCEAFDGHRVLYFAAEYGLDSLIVSLAPHQMLVNLSEPNELTPLHRAAAEGHYHTVKVLCALGADPSISTHSGLIPLFSALFLPMDHDETQKKNKVKIFRFLQELAPNTLTHQDENGDTVLHCIASYGYSTLLLEVVQQAPELVSKRNNYGHYPIHVAVLNNQTDCLKPLLNMENSQYLRDTAGDTVLHYAALYGSKETVRLCCAVFQSMEERNHEGCTPLLLAAQAGNIEALQLFIAQGADVTAKDRWGNTVLHHAVHSDGTETLGWILEHIPSIPINAENQYQETALKLCENRREVDKIKLLKAHGAS